MASQRPQSRPGAGDHRPRGRGVGLVRGQWRGPPARAGGLGRGLCLRCRDRGVRRGVPGHRRDAVGPARSAPAHVRPGRRDGLDGHRHQARPVAVACRRRGCRRGERQHAGGRAGHDDRAPQRVPDRPRQGRRRRSVPPTRPPATSAPVGCAGRERVPPVSDLRCRHRFHLRHLRHGSGADLQDLGRVQLRPRRGLCALGLRVLRPAPGARRSVAGGRVPGRVRDRPARRADHGTPGRRARAGVDGVQDRRHRRAAGVHPGPDRAALQRPGPPLRLLLPPGRGLQRRGRRRHGRLVHHGRHRGRGRDRAVRVLPLHPPRHRDPRRGR